MKTVVITGSARGLGYTMAEGFRKNNCNVVISDLKEESLKKAKNNLEEIKSDGKILTVVCNVTNYEDLENLMSETIRNFGKVDIWINNAGVNQPQEPIYKCDKSAIDAIIDIDLKGTIYGSKIAMTQMVNQKEGAIYNIEGYGSNDLLKDGRKFYVLRNHDGETTVLDTKQDGNKLTFETDKFSTYAVAYTDVADTTATTDTTTTTDGKAELDETPKTGVASPITFLSILAAISVAGILLFKNKNK